MADLSNGSILSRFFTVSKMPVIVLCRPNISFTMTVYIEACIKIHHMGICRFFLYGKMSIWGIEGWTGMVMDVDGPTSTCLRETAS